MARPRKLEETLAKLAEIRDEPASEAGITTLVSIKVITKLSSYRAGRMPTSQERYFYSHWDTPSMNCLGTCGVLNSSVRLSATVTVSISKGLNVFL